MFSCIRDTTCSRYTECIRFAADASEFLREISVRWPEVLERTECEAKVLEAKWEYLRRLGRQILLLVRHENSFRLRFRLPVIRPQMFVRL